MASRFFIAGHMYICIQQYLLYLYGAFLSAQGDPRCLLFLLPHRTPSPHTYMKAVLKIKESSTKNVSHSMERYNENWVLHPWEGERFSARTKPSLEATNYCINTSLPFSVMLKRQTTDKITGIFFLELNCSLLVFSRLILQFLPQPSKLPYGLSHPVSC